MAISRYGTPEVEVAALRAGAAGFLAKPFDNAEFLAEIIRIEREVPS